MRFQFITTLSVHIEFLCTVIPRNVIGTYQRFGGTYQRNFYLEDESRMLLRNVGCLVICGLPDGNSLGSIVSNYKIKAPPHEYVWRSVSIAPPFSTSVLDIGEW
jgi:hypothetical protein